MEESLVYGGHCILFEPILKRKKEKHDRLYHVEEQQLVLRSYEYYFNLFKEYDFKMVNSWVFAPYGVCEEEMAAYVLIK